RHPELGQPLDGLVGAAAGLGQPDGHGGCGHGLDLVHQLEAAGDDAGVEGTPAGGDLASIADLHAQHLLEVTAVARAEEGDASRDRRGEEAVRMAGHGTTSSDAQPSATTRSTPPTVSSPRRPETRSRGGRSGRRSSVRRRPSSRFAIHSGAGGSGSVRTSAWTTSSATPFRSAFSAVAPTASGSRSKHASGPKPSLAAAIASTPEPQPRSSA